MWDSIVFQNLDWQGLQMSRENNIHFKDDMKMTSASNSIAAWYQTIPPAGNSGQVG